MVLILRLTSSHHTCMLAIATPMWKIIITCANTVCWGRDYMAYVERGQRTSDFELFERANKQCMPFILNSEMPLTNVYVKNAL